MNIALDVVTVVLIVAFFIGGYKKGIVSMLLSLASSIASFVISLVGAFYLTEPIYNLFFKENITESISNAILSTAEGADSLGFYFYGRLPDFLSNIIKKSNLTDEFIASAGADGAVMIESAIAPVIQMLICGILMIVFLIVISLLLKPIQRILNGLFKLPVIGLPNKLLGGLLGLAEGFVFLVVVFAVVRVWLPYSDTLQGVFTFDNISSTAVFQHLYLSEITNKICDFFTQPKFSGGLNLA